MSGVVAIDVERLDAFAVALDDAADEIAQIAAAAVAALWSVPGEVHRLRHTRRLLADQAVDARRRAAVVRTLPTMERPPHTSVFLGRTAGPFAAATSLAHQLIELHRQQRFGWLEPDDITPVLDRFLAAVDDDPFAAAAALSVLGVHGVRWVYKLAAFEGGDVEGRIGAVTGVVFVASRSVGRPGGLARRFVHDLLSRSEADRAVDDADVPPDDAARVSELLDRAGAGDYLVETAARAVGSGRVGLVVNAGRVLAIGGLGAAVLDGLAEGPVALAEGLVTSGLGLIAAFTPGPLGWLVGGGGLLLSIAFAVGSKDGRPPARTYPTDRRNPGGTHYERFVDGAGVPVAP